MDKLNANANETNPISSCLRWTLRRSRAFPSRLRSAVQEAVTAVAPDEWHPPRHLFLVKFQLETLSIPYRVYYNPSLLRHEMNGSQGERRVILACLGTRHYDGYLRQECLAELLCSDEAWLMPFLVQLACEYVVEIAQDVAEGIVRRDAAAIRSFARENQAYLATFQRRVISYWSCYYRLAYPARQDYPGMKVAALLQQASE